MLCSPACAVITPCSRLPGPPRRAGCCCLCTIWDQRPTSSRVAAVGRISAVHPHYAARSKC
eukprot:47790-Eustigmatos_ZCMA.PRE.1